ncbi:MAG: DGQHR domain-containing protein [Chlorobiales bacterium]|jgi:DGQHR domain-containing protein|nr:DGQHR domain-containing protein [Chlorobiales bacterium]
MIATRIKQKDAVFYFISYKAKDLLEKVKFTSRYTLEGETIGLHPSVHESEQERFFRAVEKSEQGFQRSINQQKVGQIVNFYENAQGQPAIPGSILLFTEEPLTYEPLGEYVSVGNLSEPRDKYLIIDGQHRLAALHFFVQHNPEMADEISVPCVIFDGQNAAFAIEMFVIVNSTHTKISKSHMVDLYDKISWVSPQRKLAAKLTYAMYEEDSSPLQYRINRLGGRSKLDKWIMQSEFFNEISKVVEANPDFFESNFNNRADYVFPLMRDYFRAVASVMQEIWGDRKNYMFSQDVTIKAMIRIWGDLVLDAGCFAEWQAERAPQPFEKRIAGWKGIANRFRKEGFYERFPAKGQVERVGRIRKELKDALNGMSVR